MAGETLPAMRLPGITELDLAVYETVSRARETLLVRQIAAAVGRKADVVKKNCAKMARLGFIIEYEVSPLRYGHKKVSGEQQRRLAVAREAFRRKAA